MKQKKTNKMNLDYDHLKKLSLKELDAILIKLTEELKTSKNK